MTARRVLLMVLSAVGSLGVFALLFANQWIEEHIVDVDSRPGFGDMVLRWMQFPAWRLGDDRGPFSYQAIFDVGLLVFLGLLALFVFLGARGLDPERGVAGALILGWWATAAAGALAGLTRHLLWVVTEDFGGGDLAAAGVSSGATFGIVFGWLMGLATMIAFIVTRPKAPAPQPSGMLPPQHPASAPYVPPGRQAGWMPPPPSPGAGPSGGYPTPPLPAAPPQPQPHPQAPPPAPVPTPAPPEPTPVDTSDAVAMAEPAQSAAPEPVAQPPAPPEPAMPETVVEVPAAQEPAAPAAPEPVVQEPAEAVASEAEAAAPQAASPEEVVERPPASETVVLRAAASGKKDEAAVSDSPDDEDDRPLPPPS